MKVALVVPSLRQAGPVRVAFDLAEGLRTLGITSSIFHFDAGHEPPSVPFETKRISMLSGGIPEEFDIAHSHGIRPDTFLAMGRFRHRQKLVATIHNYVAEDLALLYGRPTAALASRWWKLVWRGFDALACLSTDALRYYQDDRGLADKLFVSINGRRVRQVTVGADPRHRQIMDFAAGRRVLGSNGALIARKRHETVVRALPALPDFVFVVAGEGDERERLRRLAVEEGVVDRVLFLGYQERAEDLIGCYDIFVLASTSEGCPLCLIEAAAYGKPIVTSELPGIADMLSGNEAVLFDSSSIDQFIQAVGRAGAAAPSIGARARAAYEAKMSVEAMAERYAAVYARLLSRSATNTRQMAHHAAAEDS